MTEHLGYDKHAVEGRNGATPQRHAGEDGVDRRRRRRSRSRCRGIGRARSSPVIVAKRQRRLSDVDAVVMSLYAQGADHR